MAPIVKWKEIKGSSGPQPRPRHGHRAFAVKEYMVVFGGGTYGIQHDLYIYDTLKNQWSYPQVNGEIPPGAAACGIAVDNNRVLIFGGMREYGVITGTLYELRVDSDLWTFRLLKPSPPEDFVPPMPRFGHSFTILGNTVYLFGGLTNKALVEPAENSPAFYFTNELYLLRLHANDCPAWEKPKIYGSAPHPRESHTAVAHTDSKGNRKLIVYGGMSGYRHGDLWILDIDSMTWSESIIHQPFPRSLHSATVVDNKMYIFGGWVPLNNDKNELKLTERNWKCSDQLLCMDLETLMWDELSIKSDNMPRARAGHCAVAIHGRIYMWSGRDGNITGPLLCFKDLWSLEIDCSSL